MMIRRRAGRLDQEYVLTPHIFLDFYEGFPVWKRLNRRFAQGNPYVGTNRLSQGWIGRAAKDLHDVIYRSG